MKEREKFGSRLGFILVSAGCAVGLGNVWKFPYICGEYGGAAFILIYLMFLVILGLPILLCEFAVGRASQKSMAQAYEKLEQKGEPLSSYEMAEYCWLLYADDVLYDGGRMDFVLCLPFSDRTASWSG